MRVTVFGGANPRPGEPAYEEALQLGKLLAQSGYIVLNGGYIGTMEAVSRGVAENGGHVIGVTCQEIERWRKTEANPWLNEEWHLQTLDQRLLALIDNCDAALALPGGVGTLLEISMMWNRLIIKAIAARPLILIGPGWRSVIASFIEQQGQYLTERDRQWLSFTDTIQEAVEKIQNHFAAASTGHAE
jgi:uncharacterized protein (TIGR00725 family)